jgi:hypothetical protein
VGRWPFPGDLPVDRARLVALQYREVLERLDPAACTVIDEAAVLAGESWVLREWAIETEDDYVSVERAAELVGRSTRWVYAWAARNDGAVRRRPTLIRLGAIRAAAASARRERAVAADRTSGSGGSGTRPRASNR